MSSCLSNRILPKPSGLPGDACCGFFLSCFSRNEVGVLQGISDAPDLVWRDAGQETVTVVHDVVGIILDAVGIGTLEIGIPVQLLHICITVVLGGVFAIVPSLAEHMCQP